MAAWSQASVLSHNGRVTIRRVRSEAAADDAAVKLTLFRAGNDDACGWFIGPVSVKSGGISMPYLPASEATMASVAVVRAVRAAEDAGASLCLIDPDDLWAAAWQR
jgi:hypothetical protein